MDPQLSEVDKFDRNIDGMLSELHSTVLKVKDIAVEQQIELQKHENILNDIDLEANSTRKQLMTANNSIKGLEKPSESSSNICCYIILALVCVALFVAILALSI